MSGNDVMGVLGLLVFAMHATVSFREQEWMPKALGQGLLQSHPSVHLRVALANTYYGALMLWVMYYLPSPGPFLVAAFGFGAAYMAFNAGMRGAAFWRTAR